MNVGDIKSLINSSMFTDNQSTKGKGQQQSLQSPISAGEMSAIYQRKASSSFNFSVVNRAVADKLQHMDPSTPAFKNDNNQLFDHEEVAKNVLSFVEKAVMKARGQGASDEKLNTMLADARRGVEEGFSQARDILTDMGQLSDSVNEGIDKSFELIDQGLTDFADRLFNNEPAQSTSVQPAAGSSSFAAAAVASSQLDYSLSKESSLTIKTRDGDEVQISFADMTRYQQSNHQAAAYTQSDGKESGSYVQQQESSYYRANGFSFSVDGELDDGEREAIAELVKDVGKLADEFFNGDLDKAFEQAMELGFDDSELSGFSLNMTRVEQVSVRQSFSGIADYQANAIPSGEGGGQPSAQQLMKPVEAYLADFIKFLEDARKELASDEDIFELMSRSSEKYLENQMPDQVAEGAERFKSFNQHLMDLASALQPSSDTSAGETADNTNAGEVSSDTPDSSSDTNSQS